jgi:hypothetical protein
MRASISPIHNPDIPPLEWPVTEPNLNHPQTFQRLLDCLCYALAIDDSISLASALGLPAELSNQVALSIWVRDELSGIQFFESSALFNYLVRHLDNLIEPIRRHT